MEEGCVFVCVLSIVSSSKWNTGRDITVSLFMLTLFRLYLDPNETNCSYGVGRIYEHIANADMEYRKVIWVHVLVNIY